MSSTSASERPDRREQPGVAKPKGGKSRLWLWIGLAVFLVAVTLAWFLLPVNDWLKAFQQWIGGFGLWGVVVFGLVYVVATVALAPAAPLTIAAGLAYG